MQGRATINLVVVLREEGLQTVVLRLILVVLHHTEQAVGHQELIGHHEVVSVLSFDQLRALTEVKGEDLLDLVAADVVLVKHLLRLQVDNAGLGVRHVVLIVRVEENLGVLGGRRVIHFLLQV